MKINQKNRMNIYGGSLVNGGEYLEKKVSNIGYCSIIIIFPVRESLYTLPISEYPSPLL